MAEASSANTTARAAMSLLLLLGVFAFLQAVPVEAQPGASYRCTATGCFSSGKNDRYSPVSYTARAPMKKHHTPAPPAPPPRKYHPPPPSKKHEPEPSCMEPDEFGDSLGLTFIQSCEDIKRYGSKGHSFNFEDDLVGDNCEWFNDDKCGDSSSSDCQGGGGKNHCKSSGGGGGRGNALTRFRDRNENGACLVFDTKLTRGVLRLARGDDMGDHIVHLCCRPICSSPTTTAKPREALLDLFPTTTTSTIAPREELLDLEEDRPTVAPRSGQRCVDVKYLNFPRVSTCEDLRDLAMSTRYLHVTNRRALECKWLDDYTCDDSFPEYGAYINAGLPDGICLAYRDSTCGNMVGPYPILQADERQVCFRKGAGRRKPHQMAMMMVPSGKKGGGDGGVEGGGATGFRGGARRGLSELLSLHRELQPAAPAGKKEVGLPSSTTVPLCCRVDCHRESETRADEY